MNGQGTSRAERMAGVYGTVAFSAVVLAAFGQLVLFADRYRGEPWQFLVTLIGSVIYLLIGISSSRWLDEGKPLQCFGYFAIQLALLITIILLTPGPGFFGIIALPLCAHAVFSLRWPLALFVNGLLFTTCVVSIGLAYGAANARFAAISISPAFLFTALFSALTVRSFRVSREAEQLSRELAEANERLRQQSAQAEELATARERNRLAREIHDGLGHYLTVINVQIDAARTLLVREPARAAESLTKATHLSRQALEEVRRSVANLHHDAAPAPLLARLETLCAESGLSARCTALGLPRPLAPAAEHALFRAAQEGLTNVRKHAGVPKAELQLDYREPARVLLRVLDDGTPAEAGASARPAPGGFGLRGMRERLALLQGRLQAGRRPEGGFELRVELPG